MPQVVLTIGGSDSGGGAGIQADIKTFSALGLHGTSVITAATAQNTLGVQGVFGLDSRAVAAQLESVLSDFQVSCAKTGMLYSAEIVSVVAEIMADSNLPLVVDPVIEAEAGGRLFHPQAVSALKRDLMPVARVITPNIFEARALTGIEVSDLDGMRLAALKLSEMGAGAVIIKGGHLDCTDLVLDGGEMNILRGERARGGNHGVGCTFSAALTAFLAEGCTVLEAAYRAKSFAADAIAWSMDVGRGAGPVNQAGRIIEDALRFRAIDQLERAAESLMNMPGMRLIAPESGIEIGAAIPGADSCSDIATARARPGLPLCARFCESRASGIILAAARLNPSIRAAVGLDEAAMSFSGALGLAPAKAYQIESAKVPIGLGLMPDIVLDDECSDREPVAWLLSSSIAEAVGLAESISKLAGNGKI